MVFPSPVWTQNAFRLKEILKATWGSTLPISITDPLLNAVLLRVSPKCFLYQTVAQHPRELLKCQCPTKKGAFKLWWQVVGFCHYLLLKINFNLNTLMAVMRKTYKGGFVFMTMVVDGKAEKHWLHLVETFHVITIKESWIASILWAICTPVLILHIVISITKIIEEPLALYLWPLHDLFLVVLYGRISQIDRWVKERESYF